MARAVAEDFIGGGVAPTQHLDADTQVSPYVYAQLIESGKRQNPATTGQPKWSVPL